MSISNEIGIEKEIEMKYTRQIRPLDKDDVKQNAVDDLLQMWQQEFEQTFEQMERSRKRGEAVQSVPKWFVK